jgi:hypothetical protein
MSDNNCSCWRKVYEHEADGTPLSGVLDDLVNAIKSGGVDVQIGYAFRTPTLAGEWRGEWRRTCSSVTYAENRELGVRVVSCMFTDIPDTQLSPSGRSFPFPIAFEWHSYNTTGQRWVIKFDAQTSTLSGYTANNLRIAWYVRGVQP